MSGTIPVGYIIARRFAATSQKAVTVAAGPPPRLPAASWMIWIWWLTARARLSASSLPAVFVPPPPAVAPPFPAWSALSGPVLAAGRVLRCMSSVCSGCGVGVGWGRGPGAGVGRLPTCLPSRNCSTHGVGTGVGCGRPARFPRRSRWSQNVGWPPPVLPALSAVAACSPQVCGCELPPG